MSDKEFNKIVRRYIINLAVIIICVILIILGGNGILPQIIQKISVGVIVINCIAFTIFMRKYKK